MERRTRLEHTIDAMGVRHPESALSLDRVIAPKAGRVPGMKDATKLLDPKRTTLGDSTHSD